MNYTDVWKSNGLGGTYQSSKNYLQYSKNATCIQALLQSATVPCNSREWVVQFMTNSSPIFNYSPVISRSAVPFRSLHLSLIHI